MLELILGTPGTGKTYTIFKRLTAATQDASCAGGCLLLVPEQFSFESERRLLRELGAAAASNVKVYSFTRLADIILHEAGDVAGRRMDDGTRALLVSQALSQTESVRALPRRGSDSGQVTLVSGMLSELKQCALTAADVRAQAERETGRLRDKLSDLSLLAEAYDALVERTFMDPRDTLTRAAERLPDSLVGVGAHVFVDGFTGFSAQEMNLLGGLMARAAQVTVALCTDSLQRGEDGFDLFSVTTETAHDLMRIARDRGVAIAPAVYLTDDHRYRAEGLRALQSELFRPDGQAYSEPAPEVTVAACADVYEECEMVTRTIRRILREGGRCRDIAVVARDLAPYRGLLDVSLNRAGIPTFFDAREDILTDSLTETVLAAIRAVTEGWQTESLLRLLKTGLLGFSAHSISLLEDYVYLWDLTGSGWRRPWTKSTEGFSDRRTEDDEKKLAYLNILRHRLVAPLERLYIKLKEPLCARDFSLAVIDYLQDISAARLTRLRVAQLDAVGETALADRAARLWDVMMDLLSMFGEVGPASPCPGRELSRLLQMVAGMIRLGSIPQSLDAVQIGAADRVRMSAPKVVFVLGANEGVFPRNPRSKGYFTEPERRHLLDQKMPLIRGIEWQINMERLFAYTAVTAPSEQLYVSYCTGDLAGEAKLPSSLVYAIKPVLPQCATVAEYAVSGGDAETPEEAMNRYTETYRRPTEVSATLSAALHRQPGFAEKLEALRHCAERLPWQIHDEDTAKALFKRQMKMSYTAVDTYYYCPFRYFCRYGLNVKALRRAELGAMEFGVVVHYLMEHLLPIYIEQGVGTVTREQIRRDASDWVDRYVAEQMGGTEDMPARFLYLVTRLKVLAQRLLWFVVQEQRQSRFTPRDYELTIDDTGGNAVPPLTLSLPDGTQISVTGKIDRVDTFEKDGKTYIRVLDYKTGSKAFKLNEVVEGINLQMFIYLFTLCRSDAPRYGGSEPAGVLYLPAAMPVVEAEKLQKPKRGSDPAESGDVVREREQLKKMRMDGLLIDDPAVLEAMEAGGGGSFVPAYGTRQSAAGHVASLEQFGRLKRRMEELLLQMANMIRAGKIAALPFENGNDTTCKYCDYRDVCGFEDGDPKRTLTLGLKEQIMDETPAEPGAQHE